MGTKLSGKDLAVQHKNEIKELIAGETKDGKRPPTLVSIIVGQDGGSISYTKGQKKVSDELGISYKIKMFSENIEEDKLIDEIKKLNKDDTVDGIIIQLPLPKNLNEEVILDTVDVTKDVDGLTDFNLGRLYKDKKSFMPCTARSVLELIKSQVDIKGKEVVVIGRSNIVGKPAAFLLLKENATVTICHSKTVDIGSVCRKADILVSAIGRPGFITKDFVKEGAIVIDVGTTMMEGKVKGDVCLDEVIEIASMVTPVPGGVGAMTTTMLMKNTCEAWLKNVQ
jgi:methylenetetrahydrofolate dehydrogenase (NADP+)/methenyltetrahydrofolate cyclohydrolase